MTPIERNCRLGVGFLGCRDYVPIVDVGKLDRLHQRFVPPDDAIRNSIAHQLAHADKSIFSEARPPTPQGMKTLIEYLLRPSDADQTPDSEPNQQVAGGRVLEDVGIDDNGVCHELLVSQFVFLGHHLL